MGRKKLLDKEEELEQELLKQHHKKDVTIEDFEKAIDKEYSLSVDEVEEKELSSLTMKEEIDVEEAKIVEAKRRKKLRNEVTHKLRFDVLERDKFTCFAKDTFILMSDYSIKEIKDIKVGEKVIDAYGDIQTVEYVYKKKQKHILTIHKRGSGLDLNATMDHRLKGFIRKNKGVSVNDLLECDVEAKDSFGVYISELKLSVNYLNTPNIDLRSIVDLPFLKVIDGKLKHYSGIPISMNIPVDREFGKFIGLFLAEGSLHVNNVHFSFNTNEKVLHKFIIDYVKKTFGITAKKYSYRTHNTSIVISSSILHNFFLKWCYWQRSANIKGIKNKILSKEYNEGVLEGIILGDGHIRLDDFKVAIGLKECMLLKDIYILANILGIYPTIGKLMTSFKTDSKGNKTGDKKYSRYIIFNSNEFNKLSDGIRSNTFYYSKLKTSDRLFTKAFILGRVNRIEELYYSDFVYNLQVSGSHTYIANFIRVNNCQYCGDNLKKHADIQLVVDHIIPLEKGGTNDMTNLITSCFDCNEGKKDRMLAIIGFEREYNLPVDEILRLVDLNNREENKKFFLDDKNNEARLYLHDLYRQKNELRCIKDCKECIVSGKLFFNDCMGRLNQKARYGLDDRRGINDELMRTTQGENIVTAVENRTQCDLCYISRRCPKYKVGAMCYFDFSANTDFTDTRMAMKILLNTQKSRVLRAAFFETTDGGALDKNLSNEITLLTSMIKINEEMGADKVGINIQATGSGAGVGIVEKILGDIFKNSSNKEDNKAKEVDSDIEDAEVIKND